MTTTVRALAAPKKQGSNWKKWGKRILIAIGVLVIAFGAYVVWILNQARECPVVAPGPTGERIHSRSILANYFPGRGDGPRPAVLVIGGYEGGLGNEAKSEALALQEAGFSALQVGYHCAEALPNKISRVPLERFAEALDWLKARPEIDPQRIGIVGYSKGAEASLTIAVRRQDIRAVAVGMPSSVVWDGMSPLSYIAGGLRSAWTERGLDLPSLPYGSWSHPRGGTYGVHANGLQKIAEHPDAIIPAEQIAVPILLVCGDADLVWPSCAMSEMIISRVTQNGKKAPTLLRYSQAGHGVFGPAHPLGSRMARSWSMMGGTETANTAARKDSWPKTVAFLRQHLTE